MILDIERPAQPRIDQVFTAGVQINDLNDVKLGITYVSEFAYLADGSNGLRVVQLTSPETPGNYGFSPRPTPELIALFKLPMGGKALAISKGVDRDCAVDEVREPNCRFWTRRRSTIERRRTTQDVPARRPGLETVSDDPLDPDLPIHDQPTQTLSCSPCFAVSRSDFVSRSLRSRSCRSLQLVFQSGRSSPGT